MALPVIIAKNQTGAPITIKDLGLTIAASPGQVTLTASLFVHEITNSSDLHVEVDAGNVIINVGGNDLTVAQSQTYVQPADPNVEILHNLSATVDPTVTDDENAGYSIGSTWVNTTSDLTWICTGDIVGAAVWVGVSGDVQSGALLPDNAVVRGDGGGKGIQGSGVILDDLDNITGVNDLTVNNNLVVNTDLLVTDSTTDMVTITGATSGNGFPLLTLAQDSISGEFMFCRNSIDGSVIHAIRQDPGGNPILRQISAAGVIRTQFDATDAQWWTSDGAAGNTIGLQTTTPSAAHAVDIGGALQVQGNVDLVGALVNIDGERMNGAISAYDSTGTQTFTSGAITVNMSATKFAPAAGLYVLAADQITLQVAARYLITYQCSIVVSTGTSRSQADCWLENNTVEITGTRSTVYARNLNSGATGSATIVEDFAANDVIRLRAQRTNGSSTLSPDVNGSRITIVRLS